MSYIDLSGMHFGFLVAREYAGRGYWKCKCLNCGTEKLVKGEHLRLGIIKSCGCLKEDQETRGMRGTNSYIIRTHKGEEINVDAEDVDRLAKHSWSIGIDGYPQARVSGKMMRMHELLVGQFRGEGLVIDHINHNRADNRKDNLRIVTPAQNARVVRLEEDYGRG
ncbi:HNH endonuclease signature motif containing protein [Hungatella sp.]|uniref:HNH endonuclease signature motif containing protein n=1 Tax=Hungatella sp. TaxID=2613924 RepID=UPI003AB5BE21